MSIEKISPFRFWCQKILPAVYDDSLSYYEVLCKLVAQLNNIGDTTNQLIDAFNELSNYVNNYIDTELAEAVKNRLDEMFEDGSLGTIIMSELYKNMVFESMADVVSKADNLSAGNIVTTNVFASGTNYGGASYELKEGTIDSNGYYIGNGLIAVPLNDFVAPEEIGYISLQDEYADEYIEKIFAMGKNLILKLTNYYTNSTITLENNRDYYIKSYNNSTINHSGDGYLFHAKTGRVVDTNIPAQTETEHYNKFSVTGINGVGNHLNKFLKLDKGSNWGAYCIIEKCHFNDFNSVFDIYGAFNCTFNDSFIRNCGTNTISYSRNSSTPNDYGNFTNLITFNNVSFSLSPFEKNKLHPDWLSTLTKNSCLHIERAWNVAFNTCTFDGYMAMEYVGGEAVHANSDTVCVDLTHEPATSHIWSRYITFNNCWFEKIDYAIASHRHPVSFNSCSHTNIKGYVKETNEYADFAEPKEVNVSFGLPGVSYQHAYSGIITKNPRPIFTAYYDYLDTGGVRQFSSYPLYNIGSTAAKIFVPINSYSNSYDMNDDEIESVEINLDSIGNVNDAYAQKRINGRFEVYDNKYGHYFYNWVFEILKTTKRVGTEFQPNYVVTDLRGAGNTTGSPRITPVLSISDNILTVSFTARPNLEQPVISPFYPKKFRYTFEVNFSNLAPIM